MKKNIMMLFTVCFFMLTGCYEKEILITGKTMGTTYHIKVVTGYFQNPEELKEKIEKRLETINRSMSTYIKDSEINQFNALKSTDEEFYISDDFLQVMIVAEELYKLTQGAWDGTVNPLVKLWGFGSEERKNQIPESADIDAALKDIGFHHIEISEDRHLKKKKSTVTLDLASIAKGYAVDQVAELIERAEIKNFLVEIGGEVYASGVRKDGNNWRIGINTPKKDASYSQIYKAIPLHNKALATSGDYRNFFEINSKRYAHVLDPKTGYPVSNGVVSVSVTADTCTFADGLATALMVMGHEKGLELVNEIEDVEALIIVEKKDSTLTDYSSAGFGISGK